MDDDPRTGRPARGGSVLAPRLPSDGELSDELLVAAAATGRMRLGRFQALVRERERRRLAA
jgi:hypothetical protein